MNNEFVLMGIRSPAGLAIRLTKGELAANYYEWTRICVNGNEIVAILGELSMSGSSPKVRKIGSGLSRMNNEFVLMGIRSPAGLAIRLTKGELAANYYEWTRICVNGNEIVAILGELSMSGSSPKVRKIGSGLSRMNANLS